MKQVTIKDIGGEVIKDTDVYTIQDNVFGNNLTLSSTFLRANQKTTGHSHEGQEEVYMFISGEGEMQVDDNRFKVAKDDIIIIIAYASLEFEEAKLFKPAIVFPNEKDNSLT